MTMKRTQVAGKLTEQYVDWQAFSLKVASLADIIEVCEESSSPCELAKPHLPCRSSSLAC